MNKLSLALGTFDGLHKGHLNVLNGTKNFGSDFTPAVLLFDEHPESVLFGASPPLLLTKEDKEKIISDMGILPVNVSFAKIKDFSPEEFIIFIKELGAEAIICGENFRFGKNSCGDTQILFELCKKHDIIFHVAESAYFECGLISSTRIRNSLQKGEIEKAGEMLGRNFSYTLPVSHGKGKGKAWGFPTANQRIPEDFIHLRFGVYATRVTLDGVYYPAVTNFGVCPTVSSTGNVVSETFVLGYNGDLYGENLRVEFLSFLRDEIKFSDVEALSKQIKSDSKKAVEIFGRCK